MNEQTQSQVIDRLKKQPCTQENCLSGNADNIQLIIFDRPEAKKNGLMCSACFAESQLLQQLMPVEKYVLPIRKYMSLIVSFYKEYSERKEGAHWGPSVVKKQGEALSRKLQLFYNDGLKSVLEIGQFAQNIARKAVEALRKVYQDADFDKLVQFLNEQNEIEQQRMMVSSELSNLCGKLKMGEGGRVRHANEQAQKKQADAIMANYRQQVGVAVEALRGLVELHKDCLKCIIN